MKDELSHQDELVEKLQKEKNLETANMGKGGYLKWQTSDTAGTVIRNDEHRKQQKSEGQASKLSAI